MIKANLEQPGGPIGIIGVTDEDILELRNGTPLEIDVKELAPNPAARINQVKVFFGHSYLELCDTFVAAGMPVNEDFRVKARKLDEDLKRKRIVKGRQQAARN